MKSVPHGDLPTPVQPTNWKKLSVRDEEEEDCMKGPSGSSNAS
jgi:hypothetical protein